MVCGGCAACTEVQPSTLCASQLVAVVDSSDDSLGFSANDVVAVVSTGSWDLTWESEPEHMAPFEALQTTMSLGPGDIEHRRWDDSPHEACPSGEDFLLIEFIGNAYNEPSLASDELLDAAEDMREEHDAGSVRLAVFLDGTADAPVLSIDAELTDPAGGGSLARVQLTPRFTQWVKPSGALSAVPEVAAAFSDMRGATSTQ